ncbi:MAG: hypothetical protein IH614_01125, partial [Desulfuromonadales bacterium]|nr:hypothetical protein [Desulfuromonadales bacterium]
LGTSFQVYYNKIDGWDEKAAATGIPEDSWRISALFYNDYKHGQIKPTLFAMYDPEGTWMTQASVEYSPDGQWYYKLTQMSFWGDKDADSSFAPLIGTSELSLRAGYRW